MPTRYVTRWALTQGILQIDGEYTADGKYFAQRGGHIFVGTDEAFAAPELAAQRARQMAKHKVTLLKKQIKKLESFEPKIVKQGAK